MQQNVEHLEKKFESKLNTLRVTVTKLSRDNNELWRSNQSLEQQIKDERRKERHETKRVQRMQQNVEHLENKILYLEQKFEAKLNTLKVTVTKLSRNSNELWCSNQSLEQQINEERKGTSRLIMTVHSQMNEVHKGTVDIIQSLHSNDQQGRSRQYMGKFGVDHQNSAS